MVLMVASVAIRSVAHARNGRARRAGNGVAHQRPLNRHVGDRNGFCDSGAITGRGHNASTAATMAASSSLLGVGLMS